MSEKLISEKWLSDYLDGYDVGALVKCDLGAFTMLNNFRVALMEAPAVDAFAVVRCKDCRFHEDCVIESALRAKEKEPYCSAGRKK